MPSSGRMKWIRRSRRPHRPSACPRREDDFNEHYPGKGIQFRARREEVALIGANARAALSDAELVRVSDQIGRTYDAMMATLHAINLVSPTPEQATESSAQVLRKITRLIVLQAAIDEHREWVRFYLDGRGRLPG